LPDELWNDEVSAPVDGGWPVLQVDTEHPADVDHMVAFIRAAAGVAKPPHPPPPAGSDA
jgi:hypothetical protein